MINSEVLFNLTYKMAALKPDVALTRCDIDNVKD